MEQNRCYKCGRLFRSGELDDFGVCEHCRQLEENTYQQERVAYELKKTREEARELRKQQELEQQKQREREERQQQEAQEREEREKQKQREWDEQQQQKQREWDERQQEKRARDQREREEEQRKWEREKQAHQDEIRREEIAYDKALPKCKWCGQQYSFSPDANSYYEYCSRKCAVDDLGKEKLEDYSQIGLSWIKEQINTAFRDGNVHKAIILSDGFSQFYTPEQHLTMVDALRQHRQYFITNKELADLINWHIEQAFAKGTLEQKIEMACSPWKNQLHLNDAFLSDFCLSPYIALQFIIRIFEENKTLSQEHLAIFAQVLKCLSEDDLKYWQKRSSNSSLCSMISQEQKERDEAKERERQERERQEAERKRQKEEERKRQEEERKRQEEEARKRQEERKRLEECERHYQKLIKDVQQNATKQPDTKEQISRYQSLAAEFGSLNGYKDSEKRRHHCEQQAETIRNQKYVAYCQEVARCVAMTNSRSTTSKDWENAAKRFRALSDVVSEAVQKAIQCHENAMAIRYNAMAIRYNQALELKNAKKYSEAIQAFTALEGYRDSEQQIIQCKNGIRIIKYCICALVSFILVLVAIIVGVIIERKNKDRIKSEVEIACQQGDWQRMENLGKEFGKLSPEGQAIILRSQELHKKVVKEAAEAAYHQGDWQRMETLGKELAELSQEEGQAVTARSQKLHKKVLKEAAEAAYHQGDWQRMESFGKKVGELSPLDGHILIARSQELHKKVLKEAAEVAYNQGDRQRVENLGKELAELSQEEGQAVIARSQELHVIAEEEVKAEGQELYMVVDLESWKVSYSTTGPDLSNDTCRTTELWLRGITPGTFMMGSTDGENGRSEDETQHEVTLTRKYYIGVFECTQKQWELVMGSKPSSSQGEGWPVASVTYDELRGKYKGSKWPLNPDVDADSFFGRLQVRTGLAFDLPTEAQWEYACRAGTTTALNSGKNITSTLRSANMVFLRSANMDTVGWYRMNSDGSSHPVGQKQPNAWGLYDMHGNVKEWCLDWYGDYPNTSVEDPQGVQSGESRVIRGGDWGHIARLCRSACRDGSYPSSGTSIIGFRVACRP